MKILVATLFLALSSCQSPKEAPKGVKVEQTPTKISANCICPMMWMPVCGENGKTYSNACAADCVNVKYTQGSCAKNSEE